MHLVTAKRAVFFCMLLATLSLSAKKPAQQAAIIRTIQPMGQNWELVLDYVEIRTCNCDAGFEIVNNNSKIRRLTADRQTRIYLLKNAADFIEVKMEDLLQARDGKNYGWPFDKETPFDFKLEKNRILEIRQQYFP